MTKLSAQPSPLALLLASLLTWAGPVALPGQAQVQAYRTGQFDEIPIYVPPPERTGPVFCDAYLGQAIEGIIKAPTYRGAKWGILVESLATGEIVYHYNANSFLIPASNTKLLTTAAALQRLRPEDAIFSKSVRDWVTTTNLRSNNQYAERLLKHIGGAWAAKQALTEMGISPEGFRIADGSGLSRNNFTTPRTLVNLLRAMHSDQNRDVFLSSLPVAGVSGTLRNRMRQTSAQGAVYAKTGTLRGVRALSGYLENPHHGTLIFSILVNQPGVYGNALVTGIDKVVLQLQSAAPCN